MPKISLFTFDLSDNSLGRTYLLARVLSRRFKVEIIGPMFGSQIWPPCDNKEFEFKIVKGYYYPRFLFSIKDLYNLVDGDIIYAIKPRPTSYGIGLIQHWFSKKSIVLDIDDWELATYFAASPIQKYRNFLKLRNPNGFPYILIMDKLIHLADHITVSSTFLQKRYGGTLVPHVRDTDYINPSNFDTNKIKIEHNLNNYRILMFLGTPRKHKGVEDIIETVRILDRDDIRLLIVGLEGWRSYERKLKDIADDRTIFLDMIPFHEVPHYLALADIVVIPQRNSYQSIGQVPAKIFDAMAMAKPIISTRVSMIPEILEGCGYLVEPENPGQIAKTVNAIIENWDTAVEMGKKARERCIERFSYNAIEEPLCTIFSRLLH